MAVTFSGQHVELPGGGHAVLPWSPNDSAKLLKVPTNRQRWIVVRGLPRSRQQEKWYRKLVSVVADGIGKSPRLLHVELKFEAGKILRLLTSPAFGAAVELKSCANMDNEEFAGYVAQAVELIFRDVLPGVDRKSVLEQVDQMVEAPPW